MEFKLLLWSQVPEVMKQLWTRVQITEMSGSGLKKNFLDLKIFKEKLKWNVVREISSGCSKFLSNILQKELLQKVTDIKTIKKDKLFMQTVQQISRNTEGFELEHSKHVVQLLYDCNRVGIDLNQVWSEIETKASTFPLQMLSLLRGSPDMYIETWGRISSEQLILPIKSRMDEIQQTIQQLVNDQKQMFEQQNQIKDQINNVELKIGNVESKLNAKLDAILNCVTPAY